MITQAQRIRNYDTVFPKSISKEGNSIHFIHNGRIIGYWIIGNLYKRNYFKNEANGYYGAYPHKFKERVFALFPDCDTVLHLFSGTIKEEISATRKEITFDIDPALKPTIQGDIRNLDKMPKLIKAIQRSKLILADPMYDAKDVAKHDLSVSFNKWKAIQDIGKYIKKKQFLAWLDTRPPMYSNKTWDCYAEIAVRVSTNTRMRVLTVFQKK